MKNLAVIWRNLGPGFLYAGAAIGVSHLVQSTKAGAAYGFSLLIVVLLSNLFKYPFFEAGPRYAAATGESLIQGYQRIGTWAVALFAVLTASTAFIIQAAVTVVTAALFSKLLGIELQEYQSAIILLIICAALLLRGRYEWLDKSVKWIVVTLSVCSVIALIRASGAKSDADLLPAWVTNNESFIFLLALMGWMPAPVDISVWHSIWTVEKKRSSESLSMRDALRDFHIGYWGTAFLACVFLGLGALVLSGSGDDLMAAGGGEFSNTFISIYTQTLGSWTYPIIAFAAFATMFSTTLTVLDGAPRVADELIPILRSRPRRPGLLVYRISVVLIAAVAALIIWKFQGKEVFKLLVRVATIASFVTAPLLSWLNFKLIRSRFVPKEHQPGKFYQVVAICGLIFLGGFTLLYFAFLAGILQF